MTPYVQSARPPVMLLGGEAIALSAARSLGPRGIKVYAHDQPNSYVRHSRHSEWLPLGNDGDLRTIWLDFLTGPDSEFLRGAVLLPCCDEGLELIARHRNELQDNYIIIEANDDILLAVLDKARTYQMIERLGIPGPKMWIVNTRSDIQEVLERVAYPCALKPRVSHEFAKYFPVKLFVARNADELIEAFDKVHQYELEMIVTEIIPGGEERFCSYYSYIDEQGNPLFHFTKRKLRQYPPGFGLGTYHVTDWNPDVAKAGLEFFQKMGLRGVGNVEFKLDPRDGVLKLIECNARFTLTNELLMLSGLDLTYFVYNKLTGQPLPPMNTYKRGMYAIRPLSDFLAFRSARRRGEMSWGEWLGSLMHRQHFLYFRLSDPMPSMVRIYPFLRNQLRKVMAKTSPAIPAPVPSSRSAPIKS